MSPQPNKAAQLKEEFDLARAGQLFEWARKRFGDGLVMSTSFGIQSAVTLHLAKQVCPNIPVIWVDTGYLPKETYEYAATLIDLLDINLRVARSPISPYEMETRFGRLWESGDVNDLNRYHKMRKVEPMRQALKVLKATGWVSGLRSEQTKFRSGLSHVRKVSGRHRIYPILHWTNHDIKNYMDEHKLPQHPLVGQGYTTVGDAHSSRPAAAAVTDERETRFGGLKQECGLHLN